MPDPNSKPNTNMRRALFALAILAAAACAKHAPEADPTPEPEIVSARVAGFEAPVKAGDCAEATRRAVEKPDIDVEKVATPLAMTPVPIDAKKMPKGVADKNGYFNIKFHVLVDTAGKADMATFAVDTSTHAWLTTSVKAAVARWKFAPAELAGCKVPRTYSLGISPKGKTPAAPAATKATTTKPASTTTKPGTTTTPPKKPPTAN